MKLNKRIVKGVATTVVLAHMNMALQPLMAATQPDKGASSPLAQSQLKRMQALQRDLDEARAKQTQASASPADQASARLAQVEELVRDIAFIDREGRPDNAEASRPGQEQVRAIGPNLKAKVRPLSSEQKAQQQERRQQRLAELRQLLARQQGDQQAVREEFAQTRRMLIERKLPEVILTRHDEAVKTFEQRVASFNQTAARLQQGDASALGELQSFFDQNPTKRRAAPMDPKNLPWRTPEPTKRLPAETKTAWFQNLYGQQGTRVAQLGNSLAGLEFVTPPEPGQAPSEADLAETPETQRTAAIVAKAQELGNNPVNIQNWVRNNVEWVPTWGAIQSAQDTLDKKRGNAIDIASLEIALLRAARIPARYQFGTIELPAEQVMNWVGGVTKPEAAQQLLGQGGIANRGLIEGGKISKIRMEHAWVQAYVNWAPSRGAKQGSATQHPSPVGPRNAWVPLDASFKQYEFSKGLNLKQSVPVDASVLLDAALSGATLNTTEGWVQDFNAAAAQNQLQNYQQKAKAFIDMQNSNLTMGEAIGRRIIKTEHPTLLNSTHQFNVLQTGLQVSAVPEALQHRFSFTLFDQFGGEILSHVDNVVNLSGRRVLIRYVPATSADLDALKSYLPQGVVEIDKYPSSLPGYLIKVRPQMLVEGAVVAQGDQAINMGADLSSVGGFTSQTDISRWDLTADYSHVAGQATAVGISAAGISQASLEKIRDRLQMNVVDSKSGNPDLINSLNGEQFGGDLLSSVILNWFYAAEGHARIAQSQTDVIEYAGLSYGLFHAVAQPLYSWGVPRQVKFPGVNLDVGHVRNMAWSGSNAKEQWTMFNRLRGQYMSALEHSIPEQYFTDPSKCKREGSLSIDLPACPNGVSAVKLLALAAQQGQKVFTITPSVFSENPGIVENFLTSHSFQTRQAVQSALDNGMEVSIHERPITVDGWVGAGYTVIDPATGAGGYMIEGGSNGGALFGLLIGLVVGVAVIMAGPIVAGLAGGAAFLLTQYFKHFGDNKENIDFNAARFVGIMSGIILSIILGGYVIVSFTPLFALGLVLLMFTILRLMVIELMTSDSGVRAEYRMV